jgi:hypothetical protein
MTKSFFVLLSVILIAGWLAGPVVALDTQIELPPGSGDEPPQPTSEVSADGQVPLPVSGGEAGVTGVTTPVLLGEPGFSLRYLGTYGTPEVAYLEDTAHLNYPYGLWAGGSDLWIADSAGNRALRYASDGTFQQQIGRAGFPASFDGVDLEWIADVSLDGSGNIWLVDKVAHHLVGFTPAGQLLAEVGQSRVSGTDNAHFSGPESVAFDSAGNIYVSDSNNHRVQVLDPTGAWLQTYGITNQPGTGAEFLNQPRHIVIDDTNLLYVADSGNHRVQIFDVTDPLTITLAATLGIPGVAGSDNEHFSTPTGIFVDASHIYVTDLGNSRLQVFDRLTRAYQATLQDPGSGDGQFLYPTDVAVDAAGNIYLADQGNARVQQYDAAFQYVRTYGTTGVPYLTDDQHINRPAGVAVASDQSLYVADSYGNRLLKLNPDGSLVWSAGEAGVPGNDAAHLNRPVDVALDAAGRAYVVDRNNHRVQIFDSSGAQQATLGAGLGTAAGQFQFPRGIAVADDGTIYVADTGNHRVQIFDSGLNWIGQLGTTGVPGTGDNQFFEPFDVEVSVDGNILVADHSNHRVQIFDSALNLVQTIGETGVPGQDFGHLDDPTAVAVDTSGRIYVADNWGGRIQVFDQDGAYLTTLGNSWGDLSGDLRQAQGLALDGQGNLYIAESLNHRVQVFTPGVDGWWQANINGFGDPNNYWAAALAAFQGKLYAGVYSLSGMGAQLWQRTSAGDWLQLISDGFGDPANSGISSLAVFQDWLYAGTENPNGAEIWQSADGISWAPVVEDGFGSLADAPRITALGVFDGQLYAATGSWELLNPSIMQIWRTADGENWESVTTNGFGDSRNSMVLTLQAWGGYLYVGTRNEITGGELWRSASGDAGSWEQANLNGFGSANNTAVTSLVEFQGMLFAGTRNWDSGAELWKSVDGAVWTQVAQHGFGGGANSGWVDSLVVYHGSLLVALRNYQTGAQIWSSADGGMWQQINPDGWGDNNNPHTGDGSTAVVLLNDVLYYGTQNAANGAEVWSYVTYRIFLPHLCR